MIALVRLVEKIGGEVRACSEIGWRTPTFSGVRVTATVRFIGDATENGAAFLSVIQDPDVTIDGRVIVEAKTIWSRWQSPPAEFTAQVELLLLDQAREAA